MQVYPTVYEVLDARLSSEHGINCAADAQPGQRLLVVGTLADKAGLKPLEADPFVLPRALAYYDWVCGPRNMRPNAAPTLTWATSHAIETAAGQMEWMIERLTEGCERFQDLAHHLSRTECYQLVRFVLQSAPDCSVAEMARQYGLSNVHFYRLCKKYFGQSLKRQLRVHRAASALLDGVGANRNFTQLALNHGYSSASHFCVEIKSLTGVSPSSIYEITRTH